MNLLTQEYRKDGYKMNKTIEQQRILDSFSVYSVPIIFKDLINEALNSNEWDWFKDCDGCTLVADYWTTKYHPACLVHDFLWVTGRGGKVSDLIFKDLSVIYGMPKYQAKFRFFAVRLGWVLYYKKHHAKKNNFRPHTPAMMRYIKLKNY